MPAACLRCIRKERIQMPLFEVKDIDRKIYEEELRDFLPERMIDIHTHV